MNGYENCINGKFTRKRASENRKISTIIYIYKIHLQSQTTMYII